MDNDGDNDGLIVEGQDIPAPHRRLLNTEEAAAYLGVAKSTLEKLRVYGDGPVFVKFSTRVVRYIPEDLDWYAARHRARNTSELEWPERLGVSRRLALSPYLRP